MLEVIFTLVRGLVISLLLTIVLEEITARIIGIKSKKDFITVLLVNILTNPVVVYSVYLYLIFIGKYQGVGYWILVAILETLAVLVEGFIYKRTLENKKINPYLISLILNVVSYSTGEILKLLG